MGKFKILFIVIVNLHGINLFSQKNINSRIVEYNMHLEFRTYPTFNARLHFNNNSSIFAYKTKQIDDIETIGDKGHVTIAAPDPTKYAIYHKQNELEIYEIRSSNTRLGIVENKEKLNWQQIPDTTKRIGSYTCKLATAKIKGRKYFAWYTLQIPVPYGPWRLIGLPGLILEARDESNNVFFTASKIESSVKQVSFPTARKTTFLSRSDYDIKYKSNLRNKINSIAAKSDRGVKISINSLEREEIEID